MRSRKAQVLVKPFRKFTNGKMVSKDQKTQKMVSRNQKRKSKMVSKDQKLPKSVSRNQKRKTKNGL